MKFALLLFVFSLASVVLSGCASSKATYKDSWTPRPYKVRANECQKLNHHDCDYSYHYNCPDNRNNWID